MSHSFQDYLDMNNLSNIEADKLAKIDNMIVTTPLRNFDLKPSPIHGIGFFTTVNYYPGEFIGAALVNGKRTELGRWVNHSEEPNIEILVDELGKHARMSAIKDIVAGEELTVCYVNNVNQQKGLIHYTPMEHMEIYLRGLPNAVAAEDVPSEIKQFPNCGLGVKYVYLSGGSVYIGKIHKEWSMNILASGSMYVMADPTKEKVKVEAPYVFETGAGSQKFVMCITDCVFMNVLKSNNETKTEMENRMAEDTRITKAIRKEKQCLH